ncbi:MAG: FecR domain-containing protein [bacterium]
MEPHPEDDYWLLLDRYLAGEASVAEAETVRAWLAADPARADVLGDLRRIRELAARRPPARDVDEAWNAVARATHIAPPRRRHTPRTIPVVRSEAPRWLVAAAVVLVCGGAAWAIETRTSVRASEPLVTAPAAPRIYTTERGQRAEVRLVDGTRVTLAPASRLVVPADFDIAHRDVTLVGRAMLIVVHNERKPFTVHARGAVARDVGTQFEVRAYPEDADVVVVVTEGSVQLRDSSAAVASAMIMTPGSVGRVRAGGETTVAHGIDTSRLVSWTDGTLEFRDTPVGDALAELGRWYDVDVRIADPALESRRVTATLRDQALPEILDLFAIGLGARVERRGREVVLRALERVPVTQ